MILGVDLSITNTGLALLYEIDYQNSKFKYILANIETTTKNEKRLLEFENKFLNFISSYQKKFGNLELCVIENYAYQVKFGKLFEIGEFGGILKRILLKNKIPFILVSPLSLKKFVASTSKVEKNIVMVQAYKKWKVEGNEHQIDAFVLSMIGFSILQIKKKVKEINQFRKYEQEVLKNILKGEKC